MAVNLPRHIAIVMDGNGRWAEKQGLLRIQGHETGVERVKEIIRCCREKKIPYLSLFAFSSENWARPVEEVNFLMELLVHCLREEVGQLKEQGIGLRFSGDRSQLSLVLQQEMQEAERLTLENQQLIVNIMINYGGKWDIVHAVKKIAQAVIAEQLTIDAINEPCFAAFLDTAGLPEPDLFIRTSGELRLSNFFLWQLAYTELYFTPILWPDFNAAEFQLALTAFSQRQRRFGQISYE